ncbi:hypothetical protein Tco_1542955, partial [Tanacetum coccineum]
FEEFNYLFKINPDLFTYDVQEIKTYDEYEQKLNNDKTQGLDEQWPINGVPFENFHKLDYDVLVKLEECWWKVNTNKVCPFTRWDNRLRGPYANAKSKRTFDPFLNIDRKPEWNYETNNGGNIQDGQRCMENLTHEPSACKIRRFKMAKYTFEADEEYIAIKELKHINHSEINMDARYAYWELFHKMDDG